MKRLLIALALLAIIAPLFAQTSPDNSRVPPLASVRDSAGATWSLIAGTGERMVLRNGADSMGGGSEILIWKGVAYVLGGDLRWWQYTGSTWLQVGNDPSGGPIVIPIEVTPNSKIAWTMTGRTVALALGGIYTMFTDGVGKQIGSVTCAANGANAECQAPLPVLTPGVHTLAISKTDAGKETARSNALTVISGNMIVVVPSGFRLIP